MSTTRPDPTVIAAMLPYLSECYANPSSQHCLGKVAKQAVDGARAEIAELIRAEPREIVFTSGATESNNLALIGAARFYHRRGKHIITLQTEHRAVLDPCQYLQTQGYEVTYLKPNNNGLIDLEQINQAIRADTVLMSIMHVNNEIGVIQDIATIGQLCRERGIIFHSDCAQSLGNLELNTQTMPIDLLSFSAHKIYGPKGIGALYIRRNPRVHLEPIIYGGGQEQGLRSGTLPTHQIVGFGKACTLDFKQAEVLTLRQQLWQALKTIPGITLHGDEHQRIAGNLNIGIPHIKEADLLKKLPNLAVSTQSACTTAKLQQSHVLAALDIPRELANLRISLGRFTTKQDIASIASSIQHAI